MRINLGDLGHGFGIVSIFKGGKHEAYGPIWG